MQFHRNVFVPASYGKTLLRDNILYRTGKAESKERHFPPAGLQGNIHFMIIYFTDGTGGLVYCGNYVILRGFFTFFQFSLQNDVDFLTAYVTGNVV